MFYILTVVIVIWDLMSKYYFSHFFSPYESYSILKDWLVLTYVKNTGIAFSIPITWIILKILTICIIMGVVWYYFSQEKRLRSSLIDTSFALIIWGALGNGYERIFQWYVVDFIAIKYFSIFNIADVCITLGAILYLLSTFLVPKDN